MSDCAGNVSIVDTLDEEYLQLPIKVCQRVGSAAQTFGAMKRLFDRHNEVYLSQGTIADGARLDRRTVQRHLDALEEARLIVNEGRQRFGKKHGRRRRTNTYKLSAFALESLNPYLQLPLWCLDDPTFPHRWSDHIDFAAVVSRKLMLERIAAMAARRTLWRSCATIRGSGARR